jgi:hypothetical protein
MRHQMKESIFFKNNFTYESFEKKEGIIILNDF